MDAKDEKSSPTESPLGPFVELDLSDTEIEAILRLNAEKNPQPTEALVDAFRSREPKTTGTQVSGD